MPTKDLPTYRKFSKARSALFRVVQLWSAEDHLLLVTAIFAVEKYRRFYFQDIEALIIRRTNTQRTWLIVTSICLVIFGSLCAWSAVSKFGPPSGDAPIVLAVIAGIIAFVFLLGLIVQLVLGPTCIVHLQMKNGLEKLDNFDRLRPALQMRERLVQAMAERNPETPAEVTAV